MEEANPKQDLVQVLANIEAKARGRAEFWAMWYTFSTLNQNVLASVLGKEPLFSKDEIVNGTIQIYESATSKTKISSLLFVKSKKVKKKSIFIRAIDSIKKFFRK
jgi:hypothetical protein